MKDLSQDIANILNKAADNKMYGSVEIYFEDGTITQITQRIINKVSRVRKEEVKIKQEKYSTKNIEKFL